MTRQLLAWGFLIGCAAGGVGAVIFWVYELTRFVTLSP